jgi:hypothetical protein
MNIASWINKERRLTSFIGLLLAGFILTSCSSKLVAPSTTVAPIKLNPIMIIPTQPDITAISTSIGPAVWIVAGPSQARVVAQYGLNSQGQLRSFPVGSSATSVVDNFGGVLAVGFGDLATQMGYIEFYSDITTNYLGQLSMPGPVLNLARFGYTGEIVALVSVGQAKNIYFINPEQMKIQAHFTVNPLTISMATGYDPSSFFTLYSNGQVASIESSNGAASSLFKTAVVSRAIATTADRSIILTLQCGATFCNVVLTQSATEQDLNAIPAPSATTAIAVTGNGYLVDAVGTPQVGNLQVFDVSKYI